MLFLFLFLSRFLSVNVAGCDTRSHLTLSDSSFTIKDNGEIVALTAVSVATSGRTFSVWAQDNSGLQSEMEVHLFRSTVRETEVRLLHCCNLIHVRNMMMKILLSS